jgi:hypothetical protein
LELLHLGRVIITSMNGKQRSEISYVWECATSSNSAVLVAKLGTCCVLLTMCLTYIYIAIYMLYTPMSVARMQK